MVSLFESLRADMAQLLRDMTGLKRNDNFEMIKMQAEVERLTAKIQEFEKAERLEQEYKQQVMFTKGKTTRFNELKSELQEYETLRVETPLARDLAGEEGRKEYTGVNTQLDYVLKQMVLLSDTAAIPKAAHVQPYQKANAFRFVVETLVLEQSPLVFIREMLERTVPEHQRLRFKLILEAFAQESRRDRLTERGSQAD